MSVRYRPVDAEHPTRTRPHQDSAPFASCSPGLGCRAGAPTVEAHPGRGRQHLTGHLPWCRCAGRRDPHRVINGPITGRNSGTRSIGDSSHSPASATTTLARRGTSVRRSRRTVVTQSGTKPARSRSSPGGRRRARHQQRPAGTISPRATGSARSQPLVPNSSTHPDLPAAAPVPSSHLLVRPHPRRLGERADGRCHSPCHSTCRYSA